MSSTIEFKKASEETNSYLKVKGGIKKDENKNYVNNHYNCLTNGHQWKTCLGYDYCVKCFREVIHR